MNAGAITEHFDAAQLITAAFFAFFAGLVFYLRREDKREGYPLVDLSPQGRPIQGFPEMPPPKTYRLLDGTTTQMPHYSEPSAMRAEAVGLHLGRPLIPIGDPMTAEVGAGAYTMRIDKPFLSEGRPQVQPMRVARDWTVAPGDVDLRGLAVTDANRRPIGTVSDLWVDRAVKLLRYIEVKLDGAEDERPVLVPIFHTDVSRRGVKLLRMYAGHMHTAPRLRSPDMITAREEDMVNAYFAAALRFGHASSGAALPAYAPAPRAKG